MQQDATEQVESITDRQREVARLVAEGRSNPEIADALGISLAGAKYHVSELLGRLGVERREDVAAWYREHGGPATATRGRWSRLRALWPLGALTAVGVPLALLAVALANGRVEEAPEPPAMAAMAATEIVEPTPVPTEPVPGATATPDRLPIFFEYEVREGDTLAAIASRFGVGEEHVAWNNPGAEDDDDIAPGQVLQIPSVSGIIHSVRAGETVTEIAALYDADWRDIIGFEANGLRGDPNDLRPGALILVPGGRMMPLTVVAPDRPAAGGIDAGAAGWLWPVPGSVIRLFGPEHPVGVDIAAPAGTPIVASRSGAVLFAGGNPCCSYGYHVIINHGEGYETLYAHLSEFAVALGQDVAAGDTIGWVGRTGRTPEPHLHFEVHRNGIYQDPLAYLP
ncbi:MAG: peptidoglycan DD-metalloendopeptidase family protein [Dehalococcoidia bacterium]|nr:peptidoglycan DD-metalloendopeptidase family protein [Dehalococcoidia bacterium]